MDMTGINATRTCDACPTQYEGDIDGNPFYFRARWGSWTLTVVRPGENPVRAGNEANVLFYAEKSFGDSMAGVMAHEDVERELVTAAATIRTRNISPTTWMQKINPVDHGMKMYEIFIRDGMDPQHALFRALCVACDEQRGRCEEACEDAAKDLIRKYEERPHVWDFQSMADGARKAADFIQKLPPSNLDPKTGILR